MKPRYARHLSVAVPAVLLLGITTVWLAQTQRLRWAASSAAHAALDRYCVECHNPAEFSGGIVLDPEGVDRVAADAELWEKVVRKLRTGTMPPPDNPRPDEAVYASVAGYFEAELDAAAAASPTPGELPLFRRLTRTEYRNAIRDLLAIEDMPSELDYELLLPADNASSGFDNIADLLFVSPVIMERYLGAARKISRLAVGDMRMREMVNIYRLPEQLPQDTRVDELSFGTRGGLAIRSYFPLDAEYVIDVETASAARERHEIELSVDAERVAVAAIGDSEAGFNPYGPSSHQVQFRVPIAAGPHLLGVTFVQRSEALDENIVRPRMRGRGAQPAIAMATVSGPYGATGPGSTPSRQRIFVCEPASAADEAPCAREILGRLAQRAYRRASTAADLDDLMPFYALGREEGSFETGIQSALERLLVSPQFLYRIEQDANAAGNTAYPISDVELASRISFFLWSSIPDDELLELAIASRLREPEVLSAQVERMLADPRSESMVTNFAAQWLFLRDVTAKEPDVFLFPDYDESLRRAFERETELFVDSVLRQGHSVVSLLDADYTFVNERLAKHYGMSNVQGSYFRRVGLGPDSPRGGLLGHGSILTVTSYSTRTSPVLRGKYVLDNLLAAPPPPPPPDVPALATAGEDSGEPLSMRDAMIQHRADPACASCHARMDPIGFALENFDAVGRWRDADAGQPIAAASELPDGRIVDGLAGLKALLLDEPELFVGALTEKLMMYALGRNVQYYDAPAIRAIVRAAAEQDYEFSAIVAGIVASVPFQMRTPSRAAELSVASSNAD